MNENKKMWTDVLNRESEYKNTQIEYKDKTNKNTTDMHEELSKVMLSLEEDRVTLKKYESQLAKLEMEYEHMTDKKELTKDVVSYIEVLDCVER